MRGKEVAANRGAKDFVGALKHPCGTEPLKHTVRSPHMAVLFHPFAQRFQCAQRLLGFFNETLVGVQPHVDERVVNMQDADATFLQFHTEEGIFITIFATVFIK